MRRLRLALALAALALAGSAGPAEAFDLPDCPSYFVTDPPLGTCGWTGAFCASGKGCRFECEDGMHCFGGF